MIAVKGNRSYTITDADKAFYKKQGFDIIGDDGQILEHGDGKTVPYEKYEKVVKELEELKAGAKKEPKELEDMTKPELEEVAKAYNVEYTSRTTKQELINLIKTAAGYAVEE